MNAETRKSLCTTGIAAGIVHLFLFGVLLGLTGHPGAILGLAIAGAVLITSVLARSSQSNSES